MLCSEVDEEAFETMISNINAMPPDTIVPLGDAHARPAERAGHRGAALGPSDSAVNRAGGLFSWRSAKTDHHC